MKRGERKLWRDLAEAAAKVAASTNFAEEYVAKREALAADTALGKAAQERRRAA